MLSTCCGLSPSLASGQDVTPPDHDGPLFRSGGAAVQRLSVDRTHSQLMAAQQQQTRLKTDRTTTIVLICVAAAAALIYVEYQLHHW